jgi:hypothetical protein
MLRKKIPLVAALPVILAIATGLYMFDSNAAEAKDQASVHAKVWTQEDCMQCHSQDELTRLKQSKRGDAASCPRPYDALTKKRSKLKNLEVSPYGK